jgi:Outer membrane protein beta-barrel domain
MKKTTLLFLFLGALITSAKSQNFGIKGGLNIASIGGDSQGVSSRTSFHAGIFFLSPLSEKVKIMPEVVYSSQGATAGGISFNYNYVNVPVMFNFLLSEQFFLQLGPQLGVLASADASSGSSSISIKDQLKDVDFSLGFGLGGEFNKTIINARYNYGLSSTSKASNGSFPNNVIQFSIGFKLN